MADHRRQFELPSFDLEFLEQRRLPWETVIDGGMQWVVLHEYPLAGGYNLATASAALQVPSSYPDTQIDMVYFHPHLAPTNGKAIGGLSAHEFDGRSGSSGRGTVPPPTCGDGATTASRRTCCWSTSGWSVN